MLSRRIEIFVAVTISYNMIEAIVALIEGARVSSTALIGFGLDSVIEVCSAAAVAWQFAGKDPESREKLALRVIAFSFFALALYVAVDAAPITTGLGRGASFDSRNRPDSVEFGDHAGVVVGAATRRT